MNARSRIRVRLGVSACLATGVLAAAAPAFAHALGSGTRSGSQSQKTTTTKTTTATTPVATTQTAQGVVQAISSSAVSVRELDGSSVSVPIDHSTKMTLDGKSAKLTDIKPGYVLVATWKTGSPATSVKFLRPS